MLISEIRHGFDNQQLMPPFLADTGIYSAARIADTRQSLYFAGYKFPAFGLPEELGYVYRSH